MKSAVALSLFRGNERVSFSERMEGNVLESLEPDHRGTGTAIRLTLADCPFTREAAGKTLAPPAQAQSLLRQYSPTFLVDGSHLAKERGKRDFQMLPASVRDAVEGMFESVCNTYEATCLPVPNRTLQPLETWPARLPMVVLVKDKRQLQDLHLTCTYEGLRTGAGRNEACVGLAGVVKSRGADARVLGKVKGQALFDVDKGYATRVRLTVMSEAEVEDAGLRVLVSKDHDVTWADGNTLGIAAATANQPAGSTAPRLPAR